MTGEQRKRARVTLEAAVHAHRRSHPMDRGITAFAAAVGVSRPTVRGWLRRGYASAYACPAIVAAANARWAEQGKKRRITLPDLRPEIFSQARETTG